MINYHEGKIVSLAAHYIGNHADGEDVNYTTKAITQIDESMHRLLTTYFLSHFKEPEFHEFTFHSGELELNPIYNFVSNIFDDHNCLHEQSIKIARHLFEKSKHPNIKAGELIIAYIDRIMVEDELVDAIGIFKSENKDTLLQIGFDRADLDLNEILGTSISKIDKGCIILNTERDTGYKIFNIDHSNRNRDALYWKDEFLMIQPRSNEYTQTKDYIFLTKNFIKERMSKEFDTDKSDESATMSRSEKYFKNNESFDALEYEQRVFKDDKVVEAFKDYKSEFQELRGTQLSDQFDISESAVKKQSRVFKSIIKLDKNFHIYVHGDREKIQRGVDDDGKKYYILYYEDEA